MAGERLRAYLVVWAAVALVSVSGFALAYKFRHRNHRRRAG